MAINNEEQAEYFFCLHGFDFWSIWKRKSL